MKCYKCDSEATYDVPFKACDHHWAEWWADGLLDGDRNNSRWMQYYSEAASSAGITDIKDEQTLTYGNKILRFVREIEYFDGPLMSHFTDGTADYLLKWMDITDHKHKWLAARLPAGALKKLLDQEVSITNTIGSSNELVFVYTQGSEVVSFEENIVFDNIKNELPEQDVFYDPELAPEESN